MGGGGKSFRYRIETTMSCLKPFASLEAAILAGLLAFRTCSICSKVRVKEVVARGVREVRGGIYAQDMLMAPRGLRQTVDSAGLAIAECFRKKCSRVGVLQVRLQVKSSELGGSGSLCGVIESAGDDIFFTFSPLLIQLRFICSCLCFLLIR